jgi:hypothetical protein
MMSDVSRATQGLNILLLAGLLRPLGILGGGWIVVCEESGKCWLLRTVALGEHVLDLAE